MLQQSGTPPAPKCFNPGHRAGNRTGSITGGHSTVIRLKITPLPGHLGFRKNAEGD
jgi:hypothetical protein